MHKKCKYGFYTCEFTGITEMCRICQDGSNYQEKLKLMATDSRQISATLDIEEIEEIKELADKHTRGSFSLMVALLIAEALQARKIKNLNYSRITKNQKHENNI